MARRLLGQLAAELLRSSGEDRSSASRAARSYCCGDASRTTSSWRSRASSSPIASPSAAEEAAGVGTPEEASAGEGLLSLTRNGEGAARTTFT